MNLAVIGAGYVGLVTAVVFAKFGNNVWVVNKDVEKTKNLKKGKVPFYEPGVKELLKENASRLNFTVSYKKAIPNSKIIFVCVGTPPKDNGEADLSQVFASCRSIAQNLKNYTVIVIKSTVPPDTNEKIKRLIKKETKVPFDLASCPEFLREGSAIEDTINPDRIIIGADKKEVADLLIKLHQPIGGKRIVCDPMSAQMVKYTNNAFLATKISFANAIAVICEKFGANVEEVLDGIGADKRIGRSFLYPGLGFGGSCLPKDIQALIALAKKKSYNFKFLKAVEEINKGQIDLVIRKAVRLCGGKLRGKTVAILGLSFKPETSDMREARSILLIERLKKLRVKIKAYDPVAIPEARKIIKGVKYCRDPYETVREADILFLVTEWDEFKKLDLKKIKKLMKTPVVVDGRNIYNPVQMAKLGFIYEGIGR